MRSLSLLASAAIIAGAQAHYHVDSVNGDTASLRQHYINASGADIDTPVTGNAINTDDLVCGANRPFTQVTTPLSINAGSTVKVHYNPSVYHVGPAAVYASRSTTPPFTWVKVWQDMAVTGSSGSYQWASDRISANGNVLSFTVPSGMASGRWLFRVEHTGLHVASSAGGAQFYVRCFDANIVGGGSVSSPSPSEAIPGGYTSSTVGVVWDAYNGDQTKYPGFGGPVANWGSNSGGGSSPATTTTTRVVQTTLPVQTTTTRSVQTTLPVKTTTTTTVASGGSGTVAKYGQCGGQGYTGPVTCASGSTCKVSNQYYSQCL
ncbi:hypothetical protein HDV00_012433 [Rhizophlyctis rosea]|nr:hypothetical protein HDV00_012433 [Rhizophlyctis rosea]